MKLLSIIVMLAFTNSLLAKETFTQENLQEIGNKNKKLALYVSSKLVSKFGVVSETSVDTDKGELKKRVKKKELTLKVKTSTVGIIVNRRLDYNTLYVSFDSDCLQESCAYTFKWHKKKQKYVLRVVPNQPGLSVITVKKGFPIKREARVKSRVYLKYKRDELVKVTKQTKTADGHKIK